MRYPGLRILAIGLFVSMLLGCGGSHGVSIPDPSATLGPTWPCTIYMMLPGTTAPYNGPGTCGLGNPPTGAGICRVTLPQGGSTQGWCQPPSGTGSPSGTPIPIVASSPTIPPLPVNPSPPLTPSSPGAGSPLQANPLILTLIAASQPSRTITLSEPGYSGAFFATSSNPSIVSISPASGPGPFTATEMGGGTAIIIFSDSLGNSTSVPVAAD